MPNTETIGQRIRTARKMRGKTVQQVAKAAGVTSAAIALYETGRLDKKGHRVDVVPGAMVMHQLCLFLEVAVRWVLTGEPPMSRAVYISDEEGRFLRVYRALPDRAKDQLLEDAHKYHRLFASEPSRVDPYPKVSFTAEAQETDLTAKRRNR